MSKKTQRHAFKQKVRDLHEWYWNGLRRSKLQEGATSARFTREDLEYEVGLTRAEADSVYTHLVAMEKQLKQVWRERYPVGYEVPGTGERDFERVLAAAGRPQ